MARRGRGEGGKELYGGSFGISGSDLGVLKLGGCDAGSLKLEGGFCVAVYVGTKRKRRRRLRRGWWVVEERERDERSRVFRSTVIVFLCCMIFRRISAALNCQFRRKVEYRGEKLRNHWSLEGKRYMWEMFFSCLVIQSTEEWPINLSGQILRFPQVVTCN